MRPSRFILSLIAVFGFLFLWNCNDDDPVDVIETTTIEDFFTIEDLAATAGNYQYQNRTSRITELITNEAFLQGGLVPVRIRTSEPIAYFMIGLKNVSGYYNQNATAIATNISNEYLVYLHINQGVTLDQLIILLTEYTADNVGGLTQELVFNNHGNVTGSLQVSMTWDKPNDVDLHLLQPNGETVFYGNAHSSNGAMLDVDSNAGCSIDNINNENIIFGDESIVYNGEYVVYVDVWSACDVTELTNFGVTTTYQGNHIGVTQGHNPVYGILTPDDSMVEVMRFNITNATDLPAGRISQHNVKNLSPHK